MDMRMLVELIYLLSAILFVVGLKRLQSPATARGGNALAAAAMFLAIIATIVDTQILSWSGILIGVAIGGTVGGVAARTVQMTSMPQLVGIFNGSGGGASALVAVAEFMGNPVVGAGTTGVTILLGTLIGGVTLTGSLVAFAKLQGVMTGNPITFPGQNAVNGLLTVGVLILGWMVLGGGTGQDPLTLFYGFCALAAVLGVLLVIPIGGADMPVVISLLNSYSGLAADSAGLRAWTSRSSESDRSGARTRKWWRQSSGT
jgi:NAD(P) transhydrogenase subunit beta